MSERASIRGSRGARGARGDASGRGGRGGGHASGQKDAHPEKPKKENILDLRKYADKAICVKFTGGREITGTLKGFDQLMNLVLDDVQEITRDEEGNTSTRSLGLLVARGTLLTSISPLDGTEEIPNPFAVDEEGQ